MAAFASTPSFAGRRPSSSSTRTSRSLLGCDGEPARWTLLQGEASWQAVPPGRVPANSPELLLRLARAGAGIAAVPEVLAAPYLRRGELKRVLPSWCLRPHVAWAVFPGRRLMPAKVRAFIDMLVATLPGGAASTA